MESQVLSRLKAVTQGLLFVSETDEPIRPVSLGQHAATASEILKFGNHPTDTPVQEMPLATFFHTQDPTDARMQSLRKTIEDALRDVKVFRVGDVDVTYYVVGKAEGNVAGIVTKAVETG